MEKTRKRKLIERLIIWSITFIGIIFIGVFDFWFSYSYRMDGFMDWQWMMFWTHISVILSFIWISMAMMSAVVDCNERENLVTHWLIKNTIYTFIITTGLIFCAVAYIPTIIIYSGHGNIAEIQSLVVDYAMGGELVNYTVDSSLGNWDLYLNAKEFVSSSIDAGSTSFETVSGFSIEVDPTTTYRTFLIIGTTFKHVIIPGMFIYLAITEVGYTRTKGMTRFRRSMIQFIFPCLYLSYALVLSSTGLVNPPYPVLDIGFTYEFYDGTSEISQYVSIIIYSILDIMVGVIFVATSYILYFWNDKMVDKYNVSEETKVCAVKTGETFKTEEIHQDF